MESPVEGAVLGNVEVLVEVACCRRFVDATFGFGTGLRFWLVVGFATSFGSRFGCPH